jgi:hypothetical protein
MNWTNPLENLLRHVACTGETNKIQKVLNLGVNINTRHTDNGW